MVVRLIGTGSPRPGSITTSFSTLYNGTHTVSVGDADPFRIFVLVGTHFSGSPLSSYSLLPTIGGVSMSFLTNANSSAADDGHRMAIWMAQIPTGGPTMTLSVPEYAGYSGFYIYGVVDPFSNYQAGTTSGFSTSLSSPTLSVGSYGCAVMGAVTNFDSGAISFTNNGAVRVADNEAMARGYDASTGAASVSYSASCVSSIVLVGAAAFRFSI